MFPRKERISRTTFPTIIAEGRRISSLNFNIVVMDKEIDGAPLKHGYAVVVSKKVARLSVTRHRLKRRIMAIMRTLSLPNHLIVYPKVITLKMDSKSLKEDLNTLLSTSSTSRQVGAK